LGFVGGGLLEVVEDFDGRTFRTMYTVRFPEAVTFSMLLRRSPRRGLRRRGRRWT
jgi:hypothetical protein